MPVRPRRSVLYVPGSNDKALNKSRIVDADGLILDLEDSVAPDAKQDARGAVIRTLSEDGFSDKEVFVRVNALHTPWGRDDIIAIAAAPRVNGIVIPKVEGAPIVHQVDALLEDAGRSDLPIWCMIETPRGVLRSEEIASSSPRIGGLIMGTSDLAKDLHCSHTVTRLPLVTALGLALLAARAFDLPILDGVFLGLDRDDDFRLACQQGVEFGFDGKTLIHPRTIPIANEVFAPSAASVSLARRIIAAHDLAESQGKGVVVVDGTLVERLHVMNARRILDLDEAIRKVSGPS